MRMTLGEMLKHFRIEKETKAEDICRGLCDKAMISYYEKGKGEPDTLLFARFVERMGISPECFAVMVSEEEYVYHSWREKVHDAVANEQWERIGEYLEEKEALLNACNEILVKQFYDYTKAMYLGAFKRQYKEAAQLLETAIELTIPDKEQIFISDTLLGTTELHMLVLYLYYGILGEVLDADTAGKKMFFGMENYISRGKFEAEEKAKIYPKLVCIGLDVLKDVLSVEEQLHMCEQAIRLLQRERSFYDITALLQIYIRLLKKTESEKVSFYKKQYETFSAILEDGGVDAKLHPEVLSMPIPKYYKMTEYLYSKRQEKNMTQLDLSTGICEAETYSRIEGGRRKPSSKKFKALADKLEIGWHYYRFELDTCELEAIRLRKKHRDANIKKEYGESLKVLYELEKLLDMDSPVNYQYVKSKQYMDLYYLKQMTSEDTYAKLAELLVLTHKMDMETEHLVYYSQTEQEVIGNMAILLLNMKKNEEAIVLLETVLRQMRRSEVDFEQQWNGVDFMLRVLCDSYFETKRFAEANEILRYVYKVNVKNRYGGILPRILDSIADNLENIGAQYSREYKRLYRHTYYIADFYQQDAIVKFTDAYYRKHFDKEICWY